MIEQWTYRRDRLGERWHIVPAGEHGIRGRALCGEPRQGTALSEGHAETAPVLPDLMCRRCAELGPGRSIPLREP
jgi:hypothetical protein